MADQAYRTLDAAGIASVCRKADGIIIPSSVRSMPHEKEMAASPGLLVCSIAASGFEWLDVDAATRHGIVVTFAPGREGAEVVADIRRGGNSDHFALAGYTLLPGWSYRSMWWVSHNDHGAFTARGIHGKAIYIDPAAEMGIARFASHPQGANANLDPMSLPAYHAIARYLMGD